MQLIPWWSRILPPLCHKSAWALWPCWWMMMMMMMMMMFRMSDDNVIQIEGNTWSGFYFIFRRWTIVQLEKHKGQGEFIQSYLRTELAITLRAAECYADNYTAWSHRAWLVDRFMYDKKKVIWIHTCLTHKLLNPLSSKSDQHQLSPCNINAL